MTGIKICGLKRLIDVEYVNKYLPDYVGFVFAESQRKVEPTYAALMSEHLKPGIKKVGVFVNADISAVENTVKLCGLDVIQLSGDEDVEYVKELARKAGRYFEIWKSIRVKDRDSLNAADKYPVDAYLLDACAKGSYGGSGISFDWNVATGAAESRKIILAGGLNPENVKKAVEIVKPFAVDVSSGVETGGFKDEAKIRDFIQAVRSLL